MRIRTSQKSGLLFVEYFLSFGASSTPLICLFVFARNSTDARAGPDVGVTDRMMLISSIGLIDEAKTAVSPARLPIRT